jgi:hypothetical protein
MVAPLFVSLHDGVRDKGRGHLFSTEPATVESFDRFVGCLDAVKLDVNFTLRDVS